MGTSVSARWVRTAAEVPESAVDGRHFSTTVGWSHGWEGVRTEHVADHRHLLLEGGPVAELVPYYLVSHSPLWEAYEADAGVGPIWSGPVVYSSSLYGEYGGAGGSTPDYIGTCVDLGLEQAARWEAEALIFGNLTPTEVDAWSAVRPGGTAVLVDRAYAAPIDGAGSPLPAMRRRVRQELLRQWRRAKDAGLRLRVLAGAEMLSVLDEFTDLAMAAAEKHGINIYGKDIFENLVSAPGAVLLVAEHDGRMAAAFLCFLHRRRFSMWTGGIDYSNLRELKSYAFLVYESMTYAAAHGAEIIDPGRGNFVYKQRHGFQGTDLWALVYPTAPRPALREALLRMSEGIHGYITRSLRHDELVEL
ncbi:GNAT family N-acetyltransferase [Actinoplanes sp. NPDC051346]|uniref:GNAT family N-acetyltransferase n=1 Tax=Actinoplanes sp. NPDC051346 TaxID=3155048 RepID=UPI0034167C17